MKILIAGAGIFGIAAALELRRRGHEVSVFDPGTLPHPLASSTDISKMIRADYGSDEFYADLMLESFEGWDEWNRSFSQPRYHEVGFLLLTKNPIQPGSFEAESMKTLAARGFPITRLSQAEIARRYPAFNSQVYQDGYFNARAGWAESGNVVAELASIAHREGVEIFENEGFARLLEEKGKVVGIVTTAGFERRADVTVVAAGAWTPLLLPELSDRMKPIGQPVFHLLPTSVAKLQFGEAASAKLEFGGTDTPASGWAADISKTGWYGFPAQPDGVVKIANHGAGMDLPPGVDAEIPEKYFVALREFLRESLPGLADAPIVKTRICWYCDCFDGDFFIDKHLEKPGLFVAAGGSGHGFKFAPALGKIIADGLEGKENKFAHRFRWRQAGGRRFEEARNC